LTWDYTVYPPGHFDVIWASPCCTQYSCARRNAKTPRNLSLADSLVLRSREIIDYYNPRVWFIENPQTGMLKDRPFMDGLPFSDIDYCCYCDWGYKKRTRLWNNIGFQGDRCLGKNACPNMQGRRHMATAQQGKNKTKNGMYGGMFATQQLHRIPPMLCSLIDFRGSATDRRVCRKGAHGRWPEGKQKHKNADCYLYKHTALSVSRKVDSIEQTDRSDLQRTNYWLYKQSRPHNKS
jgi:hypothetical protein